MMKIAIVHEWLETYAGSERVLEQLIACFPTADVFALVDFLAEEDRGFLRGRPVHTSFIQKLPFARRFFRHYLPLMPVAIEQFDLSSYDLVISSNHAVVKGVLTGPDQLHISYVHSPMRYAWDLQHQYLRQTRLDRGIRTLMVRWLLHRLRQWDARSANGVDVFLANSAYIARRIKKAYRRDSIVVPPPVDIDGFPLRHEKDNFFLAVSRFVPYKRVDLIAEAFASMPDSRLVVVGEGPELSRIRAAARGAPNIEFRGQISQAVLVDLMQRARALIHAAEEDFGIAMVEAQACGTPVIAYGRGGARDIIVDLADNQPTGILFEPQSAEAIADAVRQFSAATGRITPQACHNNAARFSCDVFRHRIAGIVDEYLPLARNGFPIDERLRQLQPQSRGVGEIEDTVAGEDLPRRGIG
jgi:glycosyltransferase involved in cell wall biosynthesis